MTCVANVLTFKEQFVTTTVGMGATVVLYTDRHACTVVGISKSGKRVTLRRDQVTRLDARGRSESQSYRFAADPTGQVSTARLTKRGWSSGGCKVLIGVREEYYDPNF